MRIKVDKEAGAAYIYITRNVTDNLPVHSIVVNEDLVIDFTDEGKLFGIEILNLKLLPDDLIA